MPGSMPLTDERLLMNGAITNPIFGARALPTATARSTRLPSPWVRGPAWDGVWMLSALWLAPLVLWLVHGHSDPESSPLDLLYFGLTALFWIGHRLCSTWLAYCTEAYRPLLRSQPVRFVVLPLLVTAGCFAVFLPSDTALPWTREQRLVALAILDYALVTYHFAAQHFGALSLYRSRVGRGGCAHTRRMDRLFALGVGGALVFLADILAGAVAYQDLWVDRWLVPDLARVGAGRDPRRRHAGVARRDSGHAFAEPRAPRRSLPRVLYVLGIAAMVAIALRPRSLFLFLVIWNSQHWILATGLASQTPSGEPAPGRGAAAPGLPRVEHAALGGRALPHGGVGPPAAALRGRSEPAGWHILRGPDLRRVRDGIAYILMGSGLVALGFSTGFIHYLLDRGVYRMSDPQVRSAAQGLLARAGKVAPFAER